MHYAAFLPIFLFSSSIFATPTTLKTRQTAEQCTPTSYTISGYTLITSTTHAYVNFQFKSAFPAGADVTDVVTSGATCYAGGQSLPNSNECNVGDRKLLFDLRGPQELGYYQITHTWTCGGKTWMSGNAIQIELSNKCADTGDTRTCYFQEPQTFTPQNVRQICNTPTQC